MPSLSRAVALIAAFSIVLSSAAFAKEDCNFDRPIGRCTGTVIITRTSGSAPSFAAELLVKSSQACSRVEFYVNGTPYTTVFKRNTSDTESVFGTKPITKNDIRVSICRAFVRQGGSQDNPGRQTSSGFSGRWSGSVNWGPVSVPTQITVSAHGGTASGVWHDGKSGIDTRFNGRITGNTLSFNYVARGDGSPGTGRMTLTSSSSASITFAAAPATFAGTLTRQ